MKIEFLEENGFKARFIISESSLAFVNSLRRTMKNHVPTLAVDYVDFYLNTSYLYDENLAHRIGLIPIKTDLERFNMPDKCVCEGEGCPNCQISFRLNVEGRKMVYSGDFISDDPEIVPVYDNIPVIELFEGQQLMIEAVARLGTGKEHAKFQPVSVCSYRIIPKIEIDEEKCTKCGDCIDVCAKNVFEKNDKITVRDEKDCTMCMECLKVCHDDAITVDETSNFLFTVESVGSLPVRTVIKKALEILKGKAEEMNSILEI
ncbi:MAG TPA: DNA-directed RNA polymerase subunit D [Archaeoglobaceae archaeon]|nr:DNA-directed RNA polymerase subunit D [Archaeoglobaceae archaeon]